MIGRICLITAVVFAIPGGLSAADISLIPQPGSMEVKPGRFLFDPNVVVFCGPGAADEAAKLIDMLAPAMGYSLKTVEQKPAGKSISLTLDKEYSSLGPEGYRLNIAADAINISAFDAAGLFYGIQTLRQLLPPDIFASSPAPKIKWSVPCADITDKPAFKWRGLHLDVCRHFFPKEFIKKYIDLLALHKMNIFHWHLTEDQGWRIEIKKYPLLTEVGAWRDETLIGSAGVKPWSFDGKRCDGFYTQQDIREIVAYAKGRHITVVPEIEMPGHCQAALAAYPQFGNTGEKIPVMTYWGVSENVFNVEDRTFEFLQDVLTEVMELFDSPFIHIGGDEVPKTQWQKSPDAQAKIKELGLKDEGELQSWFIRRIDKFLAGKGRRLLGWDEILEGGLAPGATVMSWRGQAGGIAAAKAGHDVVMAPGSHLYFDHYQADPKGEPLAIGGFTPLEKVYSFNPVPAELDESQAKHILGAQGQVWTEYIRTEKQVEYMAYPRAIALAEVLWTDADRKNYDDFLGRLSGHLRRLDLLDVSYCPLSKSGGMSAKIKRSKNGEVSMRCWPAKAIIYYTVDGSLPGPESLMYEEPFDFLKAGVIKAIAILDEQRGEIVEAEFGPAKKNWKIAAVSSQQAGEEAEKAIDDDTDTWWHSEYIEKSPAHPHYIDIDLGQVLNLAGATYLPRPMVGNGTVRRYAFYVSADGQAWQKTAQGDFEDIKTNPGLRKILFESPMQCRFVRFETLSEINGNPWASAAEIGILPAEK